MLNELQYNEFYRSWDHLVVRRVITSWSFTTRHWLMQRFSIPVLTPPPPSPIMPCSDVEQLKTKTHMGLDQGESIEYTKHGVSLEGHPRHGCRPEVIPGVHIVMTKQKRGLNNVGQVNPKDRYLSRKDSGLQGGDIQVVKPCKCGWRGPASCLTNVWNGHPAGTCPGRGDASGVMGFDYDGALQPQGGVC